jgi:ribosome-binding protein aMBF1 (putative translation factor)
MKRKTYDAIRQATLEQGARIKKKPCYAAVHEAVSADYAVAQVLAEARVEANLSQTDLAAAMKTTQSVVSRIESGANVSLETLHRYAVACGKRLVLKLT